MRWAATVVAAGRGTRFGRPKQLVDVAGLPLAAWSLRTFALMPEILELVIVTEREWIEPMRVAAERVLDGRGVRICAGGTSRQASVRAGLRCISSACDAVLVHDGARPLVREADVRAGMREVRDGRAAVLASPVVDTVKVADPASMTVRETPDRATLWAAQTPQFAMLDELRRAHESAIEDGVQATDDATLLERIGVQVAIVPASSANFKVTLPEDIYRAEVLLRGST